MFSWSERFELISSESNAKSSLYLESKVVSFRITQMIHIARL